MQGTIIDEGSRTAWAVAQRFVRALGIGGLAVIASLCLVDRVDATYFHSDDAPAYAERHNARNYIDRGWYYLLDDGQYYYLDKGQYNLLGGLGYSFGRPHYQRQYDWGYYQWRGGSEVRAIPEPHTIGFLGLGTLVILGSMRLFRRCCVTL